MWMKGLQNVTEDGAMGKEEIRASEGGSQVLASFAAVGRDPATCHWGTSLCPS